MTNYANNHYNMVNEWLTRTGTLGWLRGARTGEGWNERRILFPSMSGTGLRAAGDPLSGSGVLSRSGVGSEKQAKPNRPQSCANDGGRYFDDSFEGDLTSRQDVRFVLSKMCQEERRVHF